MSLLLPFLLYNVQDCIDKLIVPYIEQLSKICKGGIKKSFGIVNIKVSIT